MGRKLKKIKSYLHMAMLFAFSVGIFSSLTLPVKASEQQVTIWFDSGEGECETESITAKKWSWISLPQATREGYLIIGWNEAFKEEWGTTYLNMGMPGKLYLAREDAYLSAIWKLALTISYDACGGECSEESVVVAQTDTIVLPEASREGFEFTGWYMDEGLNEYVGTAGDNYRPENGGTLYAGWTEIEKQEFTLTFQTNGGECEENVIVVEQGEAVILPEVSREGFEFTGWYKDEGLNEYAGTIGDNYVPDSDGSFYAGWKAVESNEPDEGQECTILFDTDGGSEAAPVTAEKGTVVELPSTEKEGFRFLGWYTEKNGGEFFGNAGEKITIVDDKTVYALWEETDEEGGDGEGGNHTGTEGGENTGGTVGGNENTENPGTGDESSDVPSSGTGNGNLPGESAEDVVRFLETDANLSAQNAEAENSEIKEVSGTGLNEISGGEEAEVSEAAVQTDDVETVEPVIQTGRMSPVPAAVILAVCGVFFMAYAYIPGKKRQSESR